MTEIPKPYYFYPILIDSCTCGRKLGKYQREIAEKIIEYESEGMIKAEAKLKAFYFFDIKSVCCLKQVSDPSRYQINDIEYQAYKDFTRENISSKNKGLTSAVVWKNNYLDGENFKPTTLFLPFKKNEKPLNDKKYCISLNKIAYGNYLPKNIKEDPHLFSLQAIETKNVKGSYYKPNLKKDKIFTGVSLIFYSQKNRAFLICNKNMKVNPWDQEKISMFIPIGGKLEKEENPLIGACRSFIEETEIDLTIEQLYDQLSDVEKYEIHDVREVDESIINNNYHRFYFFYLKSDDNSFLIEELNALKDKKFTEINYIHWYKIKQDLKEVDLLSPLFKKTPFPSSWK